MAVCRRFFTLKKLLLSMLVIIGGAGIAIIMTTFVAVITVQESDISEGNTNNLSRIYHAAGRKHNSLNKYKKSNRPKEILIFGDESAMNTWFELSSMLSCFKHTDNGVRRTCPVECPQYSDSIVLSLGNASDYGGKDAIVFGVSPFTLLHHHTAIVQKQFPPNILTVFYSMESPLRVHKWISHIGTGRYHITMTYLTGSNITIPYGHYQPFEVEKDALPTNFTVGKTKLIAWMGSNCEKEVFWPRMEYIHTLQKHIQVDTYGKCGKLTCLPRLSDKCLNLLKQYKFYIAFENSECNEYLTEKFWMTSLANNIVPIVYGANREDFINFAPATSYIHASDFKNVKELARYIKLLDKHDDLYNKYFEWRRMGSIINVYPTMKPAYFCDILPFTGKDQPQQRKRISQSVWFNSCRNPIKGKFDPKKKVSLKNWSPWR